MINDPLAPNTSAHNSDGSGPGTESRRGFAIVLVIAVGLLVVLLNVSTAKTKGASSSSTPTVAATNPAVVPGTTNPTGATTPAAVTGDTTGATGASGATQPASPDIVTMVGKVKSIAANGDIAFNDGNADYTITMSSKPSVVNLANAPVSTNLIKVGGTIQITGSIVGSTIDAQTVIIPTQ